MISQHNKSGLRNPWVLGIAGLIILVLGVNGTFIWLSTQNRSTLVDRDYKTKNRKANEEVVNEIKAQQALAWKTTLKKPRTIVMGSPTLYEISVQDKDGQPVSGTMEVEAYRPADNSKDFTTAFREVSSGNYQGYISFPLKGYWELHIRITRGEDTFVVSTDKFSVAATP